MFNPKQTIMTEQNFKNHGRMVPLFHYVAFSAALFPFVFFIIQFVKAIGNESGRLHAAALLSLSTAVILALWFARVFSLKAQDRGIRAEENFRHFIATGKPLNNKLSIGQVIALRFASDDEFAELANRAANENLSAKEIKMAVKNWRGDYHRV